MKNLEKVFESENIIYVKISEELINEYLITFNDPDVQKFTSQQPKTFTYEQEQEWITEHLEKNLPIFSMIEKKTNEFIGNIEIRKIVNNIGEIGITITPNKQDKHYGTEAMKAIVEYGFRELNLDGIDLNVFNFNQRAIHCYEKVGFVIDGPGKEPYDLHMTYQKR